MSAPLELPDLRIPALGDGTPACAEVGGDFWYPEPGVGSRSETIKTARDICRGCEVLDACLAWALDNNERHGIWGGLTPRQRRGMGTGQRRDQPINHGTDGGYKAHYRRNEKPCADCRTAHSRRKDERKSAA